MQTFFELPHIALHWSQKHTAPHLCMPTIHQGLLYIDAPPLLFSFWMIQHYCKVHLLPKFPFFFLPVFFSICRWWSLPSSLPWSCELDALMPRLSSSLAAFLMRHRASEMAHKAWRRAMKRAGESGIRTRNERDERGQARCEKTRKCFSEKLWLRRNVTKRKGEHE